jgi:hypothetical protein
MLLDEKSFVNIIIPFKKKIKNKPFIFKYLKLKYKVKQKKVFYVEKVNKIRNVVIYPVNNFIKFFSKNLIKVITVLFVRKQKFFNKGRYSRNRQLYRTGVF